MKLNVGVVGATGMVGEVFMDILGKHKFPLKSLRPFASDRSEGKKVLCDKREWPVESLKSGCFDGLDLVFFSSGDDISKEWAPQAMASGAFAIDNSAAFRMDSRFPLVVPEVNAHCLPSSHDPTIIANPNCSTIQLVVVLNALKKFGLREVRVATYQAVSGAGKPGRDELISQTLEYAANKQVKSKPQAFAHTIAFNSIPHIGSFNSEGYCSEEVKIMNETRKILELPHLPVSAFTVRIPALNAHSEAVWVTLDEDVTEEQIHSSLEAGAGIRFMPQIEPSSYPTSLVASGTDPVWVGRVHKDNAIPRTWQMWIVADNILKGAALNGLQIAQKLFAL